MTDADNQLDSSAEAKVGNPGVWAAVKETDNSIGFVDFGFADGNDDVRILNIYDGAQYMTTSDNIEKQLKTDGTKTVDYPKELARPLNYITNGYPSVMEQGFIDFARSPASAQYFDDCGYFAITEFA